MDAAVGIAAVRGIEPRRAGPAPIPGVTFVSAFACPGTEGIGREAGFPVAVIAASADPLAHAAHLTHTRHAAWVAGEGPDGDAFHERGSPGDFVYRPEPFEPRWLGGEPLPPGMALVRGALAVAFPGGATPGDVSALLSSGLSDTSFHDVARRPELVRRRLARRGPAVVAPRYALARPGHREEVVPVDDLFRFRPRDLRTLVRTISLMLDGLDSLAWREAAPP